MKNVLITGGARGIGRKIVEDLSQKGYNIFLNYNKSEKEAIYLKNNYKNIEIYKADVSDYTQVKEMAKIALETYKKIDVLINNAGISKIQPITDISINDWNEIINTNLNSVFYVTKEIIENMIHNKNGLIINISSIWGIVGASCETHYSATKAGINGFTKALAKELGPSNIRVNAIAPGIIETEMNNLDDIQDLENEIPLR